MRQYLVQVEDAACEKFEAMMSLCSQAKIIDRGVMADTRTAVDRCVVKAICELRYDNVFKRRGDYAYIMLAANEEVIKGMRFFFSPKEYLDYMRELDIDKVPGRTTIYDALECTHGRYPEWTFSDHPGDTETLRRKNVVKRFMSAFMRAKLNVSDAISDNRR